MVIVILGLIGFSLYNSFADFTRGNGSSPLLTDNRMAPIKEGEDPEGRTWINIFTPTDATRMSVQGGATAEIMREGTNSFARVQSKGANDSVTFDVGEGVLNQLMGKRRPLILLPAAMMASPRRCRLTVILRGSAIAGADVMTFVIP